MTSTESSDRPSIPQYEEKKKPWRFNAVIDVTTSVACAYSNDREYPLPALKRIKSLRKEKFCWRCEAGLQRYCPIGGMGPKTIDHMVPDCNTAHLGRWPRLPRPALWHVLTQITPLFRKTIRMPWTEKFWAKPMTALTWVNDCHIFQCDDDSLLIH